MRITCTLSAALAIVGTAVAVTTNPVNDQPVNQNLTPSGGPTGANPAPAPNRGAQPAPVGMDDTLSPLLDFAPDNANLPLILTDADMADAVPVRTEVGPLASQASMRLEYTFTDAAAVQLANLAERAWASGDDAAYQDAMDELSIRGFEAVPAYSYFEPTTLGRSFGESLVREASATHADFAFHPVNGNLYAVVNAADTWTFHISTDDGETWTETFSFGVNSVDVDIAVGSGLAYVVYTSGSSATSTRIRRLEVSTG